MPISLSSQRLYDVIPVPISLSSQRLYDVIPVPRHWDPGNLPSKCTIRTRSQTGMTPYLTVIPPRR
ncbi:hypothetical protein H9I48_01945 [Wolbachia pipientis]|uniref:hypothetical protein n=1 Tax=Wolbachia pipientis TaxID=955 RepID=UPI0016510A06|nr:hypothetical protein [Wolbachia pipientis]MBC6686009.1 hypothetical protein [Wolbachia pipientis]